MRSTVKDILRWFSGIGAIFKRSTEHSLQGTRPASDIAAETRTESAATEGGAAASTTDSAVATPTAASTLIAVAAADAKISQNARVSGVVPVPADQQEIQRRRELVRKLFNDFWSGCDDKPAAFVDRLDEAETYLNERLTACGESWRLQASTRRMLGLPPRSNSRKDGSGAAHRRADCFTAGTPPVGVRRTP
jgi:hypothetical protein